MQDVCEEGQDCPQEANLVLEVEARELIKNGYRSRREKIRSCWSNTQPRDEPFKFFEIGLLQFKGNKKGRFDHGPRG